MKKLPALKLEIIHFNTEDIIVTSGIPSPQRIAGIPISKNVWYATIGSELNEVPKSATDNFVNRFDAGKKYLFQIGDHGTYSVNRKFSEYQNVSTTYAWHYENAWYTGNDLLADLDFLIPDLGQFSSTYYYSN